MLLRICLILTILAGLGTAYLGFFPVKEIITTTREARDKNLSDFKNETALYNKTHKELDKTKADLASTTAKLTETQTELDAANTKITDLDKQTADLTDKLTKTTARAEGDEQRLEAWRELDKTPDQIKGIIVLLGVTKKERDIIAGENKVLLKQRDALQEQLNTLIGDNQVVLMAPGLRGKVTAVDPKFDFVVLNIGDEQGAKDGGEMMIDRHGRLIGKVRISSVQKDTCVATILPNWRRGEVMEGDQVIY